MRHIATQQQQQQRELTNAQLREQIREQVRKSIEDAQRAAQEARAARTEVIVTPPTPPTLPPLPPMEGVTVGTPGQIIEVPITHERADDIPPRAQELGMLLVVVLGLTVVMLPIARAVGRWLDRKWTTPALPSADFSAQLQRIEQAVEAMSIEVERISESQRYLTKLQAGREPEPLALRRGLDNS